MENKEEFVKAFKQIAKNHKANNVIDKSNDEFDCYISMDVCNVPTLADVRFLCDDYDIDYRNIESNDSWGYIAVYLEY